MNEEPPSSPAQERSWLTKLWSSFSNEPTSRQELLEVIKLAADNQLIDLEALDIIEGALDVSDQQVREIMIPRSKMVIISANDTPEQFLPKIIESGHSRFPVVGETTDDIKGILLAKDLLPLILKGCTNFSIEECVRAANIIPESKRLNVLLREFREKRYHMALVIDEYGSISGLVTIEDILEEIVGEIEDETDDDQNNAFIRKIGEHDYTINALTPIEEFNEHFEANLNDDEFDTMGGILTQQFGHLPQRGEVTELEGFVFRVQSANSRQLHTLRMTLPTTA